MASYCMPAGMSVTSFASMGETGGMTGRSMVPILKAEAASRAPDGSRGGRPAGRRFSRRAAAAPGI
ncbi:hypothetical protein HOK021_40870 [Streptomyces hygroscopicus]|nr:hypothetical protein HOK021_40870 [Streptomyces hygroscopicus]